MLFYRLLRCLFNPARLFRCVMAGPSSARLGFSDKPGIGVIGNLSTNVWPRSLQLYPFALKLNDEVATRSCETKFEDLIYYIVHCQVEVG